MEKSDFFEDTQTPLSKLFDEQDEDVSYVSNDFFVKNKDKYLPKEVLEAHYHETKKLKYLDSFLTRYIYYSFTRWLNRMKMFLSLETTEWYRIYDYDNLWKTRKITFSINRQRISSSSTTDKELESSPKERYCPTLVVKLYLFSDWQTDYWGVAIENVDFSWIYPRIIHQ